MLSKGNEAGEVSSTVPLEVLQLTRNPTTAVTETSNFVDSFSIYDVPPSRGRRKHAPAPVRASVKHWPFSRASLEQTADQTHPNDEEQSLNRPLIGESSLMGRAMIA